MLNTDGFILLAGNPLEWDRDTLRRRAQDAHNDDLLCSIQVAQHRRGFRGATLAETVYGWSVRLASGLDGRQILARAMTLEQALEFGIAWANQDPNNREFFCYRDTAVKHGFIDRAIPYDPKG